MGIKTGAASARVLSEMYREKKLGNEPRASVTSRSPSSGQTDDDAGRRVQDEPLHPEARQA
jgi:hypothetical protein